MNTLDNLLSARAIDCFRDQLESNLNYSTWTANDRDQRLEDAMQSFKNIAVDTDAFTQRVLTLEIEGQTFLSWKLTSQFLASMVEFLRNMREEYDFLDDMARTECPYDQQWLSDKIRQYGMESAEIEQRIESAVSALIAQEQQEAVQEL